MFPDLVEILLLMFADDLALISDTVIGLQHLPNLLYSFCKVKDLIVNTIKTKVMVYKNGGTLAKTERWSYDGENLEVDPCFTYLGLNFTRQLSLKEKESEFWYLFYQNCVNMDSCLVMYFLKYSIQKLFLSSCTEQKSGA